MPGLRTRVPVIINAVCTPGGCVYLVIDPLVCRPGVSRPSGVYLVIRPCVYQVIDPSGESI